LTAYPKPMPPKKQLKIKLNGNEVVCRSGQTIFEVAAAAGVEIPTLCEHPDFPHKANCRVCVVEVKNPSAGSAGSLQASSGQVAKLLTSCSTPVVDGMEVRTDSSRVKRSRNLNLELIFADHVEKCATCVWRLNCKLLHYAEKYKIPLNRFKDRKGNRPTYKFENAVELDATQCIDCLNCIEACSRIAGINYLELRGKGADQEVVPTKDKNITCILCGQCAVHCPVSSAQEQAHWQEAEKALKEKFSQNGRKKKTRVALVAPYVRISLCEDFGLKHGSLKVDQLTAGLKLLGFDFVFDLGLSLPIAAAEQAKELARAGGKTIFSSCCPAWVKYVKFYRSDIVSQLSAVKPPHIRSGELIKTKWATKNKIKPKDIVVVSISPCTAKKYEVALRENKVNGSPAVDIALTTRELAWLIKKNNVKLGDLKGVGPDKIGEEKITDYPGGGQILFDLLDQQQQLAYYTEQGLLALEVKIKNKKYKFGFIKGMKAAQDILAKAGEFDYLEVLACPGGCPGGGGEPIPTTEKIIKKRISALLAKKP